MAVVYIMCGTTNKNRREQDNTTDGVEKDPCFTEATLLDRLLDNPPVTKSHNQKKRIQNKTSQKPPNFATKREQNTHNCPNLRVDATTFSLQPSQPSERKQKERK
jgi:hypothetical protein